VIENASAELVVLTRAPASVDIQNIRVVDRVTMCASGGHCRCLPAQSKGGANETGRGESLE
jgi:hypothetical protein